jgi:hypothetical protein
MLIPVLPPTMKTFDYPLISPYTQTFSTRTSEFLVQFEYSGQSHIAFMAEASREKEPEPVVFFDLTLGGTLRPFLNP